MASSPPGPGKLAGYDPVDDWVADGKRFAPKLDRVEETLLAAGHLSEEPTLGEIRAWLADIASELDGAPDDVRALVREGAIEELTPHVRAPARVIDATLTRSPAPTREGQGEVLALEDPDPWPEDVDGADLLSDLEASFSRFLALPDGTALALALWTAHAHAHDAFRVSPVLAITSPEKRCGKTTLLDLLSALVPRPLPAANVTPATVFRAVERWRPTFLVDEADTFLNRGSELKGILNSGHLRSQAFVLRTVGDDHEARRFRTWAPKAIALIGRLPDTLADRSIEIRMRRRTPDEPIDRLRRDRLGKLEPLRRRAWTWARERLGALEDADPEMPDGLNDRERDNWRPLLSVADGAGGPWPQRAREAVMALRDSGRGDDSLGTQLLADVRKILRDHDSDRIRSKTLVEKLHNLEEAPWSEYRGKGLSAVSLANFLRSFDVSSKKIRFANGPYRGYEGCAFEDAFRRYLAPTPLEDPTSQGRTVEHPNNDAPSDDSEGRNAEGRVPSRESAEGPRNAYDVPGAPGREEGGGAEGGSDALQRSLDELFDRDRG